MEAKDEVVGGGGVQVDGSPGAVAPAVEVALLLLEIVADVQFGWVGAAGTGFVEEHEDGFWEGEGDGEGEKSYNTSYMVGVHIHHYISTNR